jgi:hypothetical protein
LAILAIVPFFVPFFVPNVGDIWGHLGTNGDKWGHLGTFGDIWGHLGTFGDKWGQMGTNMTGGDKTPIKSILAFWEIKENYFGAKG